MYKNFGTNLKRVCDLLYWSSVVISVLSCPVSEILDLLDAKSHILYKPPYSGQNSGCFSWIISPYTMMLGSAKSEPPSRLTNREIISDVFQPM